MINATSHQNNKTISSHPTKVESIPNNVSSIRNTYRKKRFNIKIILGSFVLVLLMLGSGAGLYLTQYTQQDIRQQAYVGKKGCTTDAQCDSARKDPNVKEYCSSSGVCTTKAPQIVQRKDCAWAKDGDFACETLTKCVQCVDGKKVTASRASCEKQNPNALCKPATNDKDCGWASHNEYACKTLTECVQCVNGAMTNVERSKCKNLACAPEEPKNEEKEIPKDKEKVCGQLSQACCDKKSAVKACDTGLTCENNKCIKPVVNKKRYSCTNSGSCKEDPQGDFLNLGSCSTNCKANDTPIPYASCSQRGTKSCTINGQAGTQTCTYTRRNASEPYGCNQLPINCDSCVATDVKQCTYSSNVSQNEKECSVGNILRVCNDTDHWSVATCKFDCSGGSCCGDKGQSCCPGDNPCDSQFACINNKCSLIGPEPAPVDTLPTDDEPAPITTTAKNPHLSGKSCNGPNFIQVCGESMIQLCQYKNRNTQSPYECDQNMSCGQCVKVDTTITSIDSGVVIQNTPASGCNPQTQRPYCLNDYTVAQCLSNQQTGSWYEVDCSTKCSNGVCLDPTTYANQQENYTTITNSISNDENSTFDILDVTNNL